MVSGEDPEQLRDERQIQDRHDPQMERAAQLTRLAAQVLEEIFNLSENGARMLLEDNARGSEQNPFPAALKKGDSQRRLQIAHLLRDTRLRDTQSIRRP